MHSDFAFMTNWRAVEHSRDAVVHVQDVTIVMWSSPLLQAHRHARSGQDNVARIVVILAAYMMKARVKLQRCDNSGCRGCIGQRAAEHDLAMAQMNAEQAIESYGCDGALM